MSHPEQAEMFWQAFRFVGEEMSADELSAFEAQLEQSQAAREAVAQVVQLSQLVAAAEAQREAARAIVSPVSRSSGWREAIGWAALGAAACLAAVMAFQSSGNVPGSKGSSGSSSHPAGDLALAWALTHHDVLNHDVLIHELPAGDLGFAEQGSAAGSALPGGSDAGQPASLAAAGTVHDDAVADEAIVHDDEARDAAPSWLLAALEDMQRAATPQE